MSLFMETTQISPEKTISEIQAILCEYKATSIMMEFESSNVTSVSFRINVDGKLVPFRLPCRYQNIQELLASRSRDYKQAWSKERRMEILKRFEDQARRVAWRQILRWIQAQFALVQTGMVKTEEVFLPYAQIADGTTIFEYMESSGFSPMLLENKS